MRLGTRLLAALLLAVPATALTLARPTPVSAQLVVVNKDYVVTELRPGKMQIGVAETKGADTRNWVCLKSTTRVNMRTWDGHRFIDKRIPPADVFRYLHPGRRFKVEGGRDWDQTVVAKKIWF